MQVLIILWQCFTQKLIKESLQHFFACSNHQVSSSSESSSNIKVSHPFSTCLTTTCHFPLSSHPSFLHTIRSSRAIFFRIIIKLAILDLLFRSVFGHWLYVDVIWKTQVIIHHIPCLGQSLGSWMLVDVVEVVVIYNKDFLMKQDPKNLIYSYSHQNVSGDLL